MSVQTPHKLFVFGSNEAGIHGAGAARIALEKYGAKMGQGYGVAGNSFAIPTKDHLIKTLPIKQIIPYVDMFIEFAYATNLPSREPEKQTHLFKVTRIGCGLANYKDSDIAPLFKRVVDEKLKNVFFDTEWRPYLGDNTNYWGTY